MKKQGMIWFNILRFFAPLCAVWSLSATFSNLYVTAHFSAAGMRYLIQYSAPLYGYTSIVFAIIGAVAAGRMTVAVWQKSPNCVKCARDMIIVNTVAVVGVSLAEYISFGETDELGVLWQLFIVYLTWLPTYFYMRNRFSPAYQYTAEPPQNNSVDDSPVLFPQPEQPKPAKPSSTPQAMSDRIDAVASRLKGVSDQGERDSLIAMMFCGQLNPYTGQPMTSEKEWQNYTQSYYEEMAWKMNETVEPHCEPEAAPAPEPQPDVEIGEHHAEETAKEPTPEPEPQPEVQVKQQPETERPKFCRKCGKPLRVDSDFCEWCGESVK